MSELNPTGQPVSINLIMLLDAVRSRIAVSNIQSVSAETGITRATLYDIAAGRRTPTIETFQKLLDRFEFAVDAATHKQVLPPVVRGSSEG